MVDSVVTEDPPLKANVSDHLLMERGYRMSVVLTEVGSIGVCETNTDCFSTSPLVRGHER